MADLRHVWVRATDLQLVRADRIVSLIAVGPHGRAERPGERYKRGSLRICAEVEGGTEGDSITRVDLADTDAGQAAAVIEDLAAILATAAGAGDGCLFVFPERDVRGAIRWLASPKLPAWQELGPSLAERTGI
jgi:hypothetical protein